MCRRLQRAVTLALITLAALLVHAAPTYAHAVLVGSFPAQGQHVDKAPPWVEVQFNEPVAAAFTPLVVRDSRGQQVDLGDAAVDKDDPTKVTVSLKQPLPPGLYTASYRVTSLDGHPVDGVIAFTVGATNEGLQAGTAAPTEVQVPAAVSLVHGLMQCAVALLAGLPLFLALVWLPALGQGPVRLERWAAGLFLLLVGLGLAEVSLYAVRASGQAWSIALFLRALTATRVGSIWLARAGLGLLTAAALAWAPRLRSPIASGLALLPGLGLLGTLSFQSHAMATREFLPVVMDWAHLLAVAPWLGGLAGFTFWLRPVLAGRSPEERDQLLGDLVPRFSRVALVAVLLLAATGLYGAVLHIPAVQALWTTRYGWSLLTKLLLLLPVLALAGYNLLRRGRGAFRLAVGTELLLVFAIFVAAGFLTSLPPAKVEIALRQGPFEESAETEGYSIWLQVSPNRLGMNAAEIHLHGPDGAPEAGASVGLRLDMLEHEMAQQNIDATESGPGVYRAGDLILGMPGLWRVEVVALTKQGREIRCEFRVEVPSPP